MKTYGVSTGESGKYGIGDIFEGSNISKDENGNVSLDGEEVLSIFKSDSEVETVY